MPAGLLVTSEESNDGVFAAVHESADDLGCVKTLCLK
jgi:hypothetical protein